MTRRKLAPPRWHTDPKTWQAELLRNSHLTMNEKLIALALSRRFTNHDAIWINLDEIARETGLSVADVRAMLDRFNGTLITVLDS